MLITTAADNSLLGANVFLYDKTSILERIPVLSYCKDPDQTEQAHRLPCKTKMSCIHSNRQGAFFIRKMLISFLFLHENTCCGYSLEAPHWGTSNEYPQHMFSWRNKKTIMWIPTLICSYVISHQLHIVPIQNKQIKNDLCCKKLCVYGLRDLEQQNA